MNIQGCEILFVLKVQWCEILSCMNVQGCEIWSCMNIQGWEIWSGMNVQWCERWSCMNVQRCEIWFVLKLQGSKIWSCMNVQGCEIWFVQKVQGCEILQCMNIQGCEIRSCMKLKSLSHIVCAGARIWGAIVHKLQGRKTWSCVKVQGCEIWWRFSDARYYVVTTPHRYVAMWVTSVTDASCCKNYFDILKYSPKEKCVISVHSRLPLVLFFPETQQKRMINNKIPQLVFCLFLHIRGLATKQLNDLNSSFPVLSISLFFCPVAAVNSSAYVFLSTIVVVSSSALRWERHQSF